MKKTHLASAILLSAMITSGAWAQEGANPAMDSEAELDIIMSVVDEDDTPEDVINRIELPPAPDTIAELPDVELAEPPLNRAEEVINKATLDASTSVTESINDALSTGDLENLPRDITDVLPTEVIEELIDGTADDVDGLIDESLQATGKLDGTVEELGGVKSTVGGSL